MGKNLFYLSMLCFAVGLMHGTPSMAIDGNQDPIGDIQRAITKVENRTDGTQVDEIQPGKTPFGVATEIFWKGSIDGKQNWIVLGVDKGAQITREVFKNTIDLDELVEVGADIYDPNGHAHWESGCGKRSKVSVEAHNHDIVGALKDSINNAKECAPRILSRPWRSLKKIPSAFRVNLEQGNEAYYHSSSSTVGSMKYSGWAAWAVIEGSYYLVVEAPATSVFSVVETLVKTASPIVYQPFKITWDAGAVLVRLAVAPAAASVIGTYSVLSSSFAAAASIVYAGGVSFFNGMKWVAYDLPRYSRYPVRVDFQTGLGIDSQQELAERLVSQWNLRHCFKVTSEINKYKSKITLRTEGSGPVPDNTAFGIIWVYPVNGKLVVRAEMTRSFVRALAHADQKNYTETKVSMREALQVDMAEMIKFALNK